MSKRLLIDRISGYTPALIFALVGYLWTHEAELRNEAMKAESATRAAADAAILKRLEELDTRVDQHDIDIAVIRAAQSQGQ
jgi:hypothetical protein